MFWYPHQMIYHSSKLFEIVKGGLTLEKELDLMNCIRNVHRLDKRAICWRSNTERDYSLLYQQWQLWTHQNKRWIQW